MNVSVIGAGGIGSNLVRSVAPAISTGPLVETLGGVNLMIFDSDTVEEKNLRLGQRFGHGDLGKSKVGAIKGSILPLEGDLLSILAFEHDIREAGDIQESDVVVVCVDNMHARKVVHSLDVPWLDLRCSGDGYIAIDHRVEDSVVSSLSDDLTHSHSCQLEGWESGFLQAGFLAAAAHGYQWLISIMRQLSGLERAVLPEPRSTSVTFGTLGKLPIKEEI